MKKVINGKLYDTATAREVSCVGHGGQSFRDFNYYQETLYCKRTGEYFLYGNGGPASKYAQYVDYNTRSGGQKIIPLTLAQAKAWAEEELTGDEYEEEFGTVDESGERVTLSISMDSATADRIRKAAQEAGISISALIASKF